MKTRPRQGPSPGVRAAHGLLPGEAGARGRRRPGGGGGGPPGRRGGGRRCAPPCPAPRCASPGRRSSSAPPTRSWPPRPSLRGYRGPVDDPLRRHAAAHHAHARRGGGRPHLAPRRSPSPPWTSRTPRATAGWCTRRARGRRSSWRRRTPPPEERQIREVNAGLYVADAAFLWSTLARVDAKNAQREFYLTDLVALAADGPGAVAVRVSPVEASGVNDQEDLSLAVRAMTRRIAGASWSRASPSRTRSASTPTRACRGRPRHGDRAGRPAARHDPHRRGLRRSARAASSSTRWWATA